MLVIYIILYNDKKSLFLLFNCPFLYPSPKTAPMELSESVINLRKYQLLSSLSVDCEKSN